MSNRLHWDRDGRYWPNRESSRFVQAAHMRWHVQIMGDGPAILMLHGIGASSHSRGALAPLLAEHFTVVALDLPGHGFNSAVATNRLSSPGMARSLDRLLRSNRRWPSAIRPAPPLWSSCASRATSRPAPSSA